MPEYFIQWNSTFADSALTVNFFQLQYFSVSVLCGCLHVCPGFTHIALIVQYLSYFRFTFSTWAQDYFLYFVLSTVLAQSLVFNFHSKFDEIIIDKCISNYFVNYRTWIMEFNLFLNKTFFYSVSSKPSVLHSFTARNKVMYFMRWHCFL